MLIIHLLDKSQEVASVAQPMDTTFPLVSTTCGGDCCAELLPKSNVLKSHTNSNAIVTIANAHNVPKRYLFPCLWK